MQCVHSVNQYILFYSFSTFMPIQCIESYLFLMESSPLFLCYCVQIGKISMFFMVICLYVGKAYIINIFTMLPFSSERSLLSHEFKLILQNILGLINQNFETRVRVIGVFMLQRTMLIVSVKHGIQHLMIMKRRKICLFRLKKLANFRIQHTTSSIFHHLWRVTNFTTYK